VNAAQHSREAFAVGAIYTQLKSLARDPEKLADQIRKRFSSDLPGTLTKVAGAVVADLLKLASDKAENTIKTAKEIITGETPPPTAAAQLDNLESENRTFFISQFLSALADSGNAVVLAVDNFESADTSLVSLLRVLVSQKPSKVALVLAHNSEVGRNEAWDNVLADVRGRRGFIRTVGPLDRPAIEAWFQKEIGRPPTEAALQELDHFANGRAQDIKRALEALKDGRVEMPADYSGYYERSRRSLSGEARTAAELLAVINRDAMVHEDQLAGAAKQLGVENLGPALDQLADQRLVKRDGRMVSLSHSIVRQSWLEAINGNRKDDLANAWFSTVRSFDVVQLTGAAASPLLPLIATPLLRSRSAADVGLVGGRLIDLGQTTTGLELLDPLWRVERGKGADDMAMHQHALLAARTRLDLGRYREVDEPLAIAERAARDDASKLQVLLVRMKLALRRNSYSALSAIAHELNQKPTDDIAIRLESALLQNGAYRDLMDLENLRASTELLVKLRNVADQDQRNSIDRALARSLAKLGDMDTALTYARTALESAPSLGSIRALGNSHLAMAEVLRYRREFPSAILRYQEAASIARASGNRDSLLWSLLGETAAQLEAGKLDRAAERLQEVDALLKEPGYEHPLEAAHSQLLHLLSSRSSAAGDDVVATYARLQIHWPKQFLLAKSSGHVKPTPL
jgi:tetratricopeptide (TPR) repeat protein